MCQDYFLLHTRCTHNSLYRHKLCHRRSSPLLTWKHAYHASPSCTRPPRCRNDDSLCPECVERAQFEDEERFHGGVMKQSHPDPNTRPATPPPAYHSLFHPSAGSPSGSTPPPSYTSNPSPPSSPGDPREYRSPPKEFEQKRNILTIICILLSCFLLSGCGGTKLKACLWIVNLYIWPQAWKMWMQYDTAVRRWVYPNGCWAPEFER